MKSILRLPRFLKYVIADVERAVHTNTKKRLSLTSFDGDVYIRANQGHTVEGINPDDLLTRILNAEEIPICIHGTYRAPLPLIMKSGLQRMGRNHIHLTNGRVEDVVSGVRKNVEVLIYVNVAKAMEQGLAFYCSENDVILCRGPIPPDCFDKV